MSNPEGEAKPKGEGSTRVVVAALIINLLIAGFKFFAAFVSRSSAMLAEAAHSLADTCNQIFLLIGMRKAARKPDLKHPFGYGPETYFWAFMVALCIFTLGCGFSLHEGFEKIFHHDEASQKLGDIRWAVGVLLMSVVLESYSLSVAMKEFRHLRAGRGIRRTLEEARDPTVLTVLFEDLAALLGLAMALGGILLTHYTGSPVWDGVASVLVGLVLGAVAVMLARDSKSLLIGKGVIPADDELIRAIVTANADVAEVVHLRTLYLGPTEALAAIKVRFVGNLDTRTLEARINEIEAALRAKLPFLRRIYIEPGFDESVGRGDAAARLA